MLASFSSVRRCARAWMLAGKNTTHSPFDLNTRTPPARCPASQPPQRQSPIRSSSSLGQPLVDRQLVREDVHANAVQQIVGDSAQVGGGSKRVTLHRRLPDDVDNDAASRRATQQVGLADHEADRRKYALRGKYSADVESGGRRGTPSRSLSDEGEEKRGSSDSGLLFDTQKQRGKPNRGIHDESEAGERRGGMPSGMRTNVSQIHITRMGMQNYGRANGNDSVVSRGMPNGVHPRAYVEIPADSDHFGGEELGVLTLHDQNAWATQREWKGLKVRKSAWSDEEGESA